MSDVVATELTEGESESVTEPHHDELPDDHPLVKRLAAQKVQLKELKELRAAKARLDEIEESQKTEAEKVADRLAKADAEVAAIPAKVCEALKAHLIVLHSIDQEDAELFLTATDPDQLLKQVERLVTQSGKRNNNYVPREGRTPPTEPASDMRDFARNLFGTKP